MQCKDFELRIDAVLDRREPLQRDKQLQAHAATCVSCKILLKSHQDLMQAFPVVQLPIPRAEAATNYRAALAIAAALLAGVFLWNRSFLASPNLEVAENSGLPTTHPITMPEEHVAVATQPTTPAINTTLPLPTASVTLPLIQTTENQAYFVHQPLVGLRLLAMGDWTDTVQSMSTSLGTEVRMESQWLEAAAQGIVPVRKTMNSTLDILRRTLYAPAAKQTVNG